VDVIVTTPDTDLDGAIVELYEAGGHLHAEVRIPAPHVIRHATFHDLTLDPHYTPPWPGAGIQSVRPAD
jgi:hypothetical protein